MPSTSASTPVAVVLEIGAKRVFASAVEWPGWSRSGRDEAAAQAALLDYAARYAPVAQRAGVRFAAPAQAEVIERVRGDATTDFGAPSRPAALESEPMTPAAARRLVALVEAVWTELDDVAARTPAALRKGPRGGGRDRDAMVDHVLSAENAYARKIGVRVTKPRVGDGAAITALRDGIVATLRAGLTDPASPGFSWPPRYAARRIAWHALDHAWEMEDRAQP